MNFSPRIDTHATAFFGLILLFCLSFPANALEYQLGQGLQLGPVNVGGYINLIGKGPRRGDAELELDDLSLFLSGRFHRWLQPFVEVEYTGQTLWKENHGAFSPDDGKWVLERAYNDLSVTPDWRLRLGKMLSPVGQWNLIHAAPLVLTTVRPLTTFRNFSVFASGIAFLSASNDTFFLYYQPWGELAPLPKRFAPRRYRQVLGGRFVFGDTLDHWLWASIQAAKLNSRRHWQTLFSLDGGFKWKLLTVEAQTTYNHLYNENSGLQHTNEWGGYLQTSLAVHTYWSFIVRAEGFRDRNNRGIHTNQLLGVVFHPHPAIKWKLEYLWTQGPGLGLDEGVFGSIAVLF